jgi:hypothetical protein
MLGAVGTIAIAAGEAFAGASSLLLSADASVLLVGTDYGVVAMTTLCNMPPAPPAVVPSPGETARAAPGDDVCVCGRRRRVACANAESHWRAYCRAA